MIDDVIVSAAPLPACPEVLSPEQGAFLGTLPNLIKWTEVCQFCVFIYKRKNHPILNVIVSILDNDNRCHMCNIMTFNSLATRTSPTSSRLAPVNTVNGPRHRYFQASTHTGTHQYLTYHGHNIHSFVRIVSRRVVSTARATTGARNAHSWLKARQSSTNTRIRHRSTRLHSTAGQWKRPTLANSL